MDDAAKMFTGVTLMAVGNQTPVDVATDYAALAFIIQQKISEISTLTLVRVVSCTNDGGIAPVGTVTVQPLVNIMSGDRVAFQHKALYNLPYQRVQGGTSAVIIDPRPGDLGVAGFCSRDISAVKASQAEANPGSFRQFSMADGVYMMTCMGAVAPEQYIAFSDAGVKIVSPTLIELQAPTINLKGDVVQTGGDVTMSGDLTVDGTVTGGTDVIANTISGKTHTHSGVTTGGGTSGPPVP